MKKKQFLPYLISTPILFIIGALLVYYLIMPLAIKFFLGFETVASQNQIAIELEAKVNEYLFFNETYFCVWYKFSIACCLKFACTCWCN